MHHNRQSHERPPLPGAGTMEDYTAAFLWSADVLIFLALFAVWAVWGLPGVLLLSVLAIVASVIHGLPIYNAMKQG